jgi:hypothetical protein
MWCRWLNMKKGDHFIERNKIERKIRQSCNIPNFAVCKVTDGYFNHIWIVGHDWLCMFQTQSEAIESRVAPRHGTQALEFFFLA